MAKILVVEDEPDLRITIVEELNNEGYVTIEAGDGLEGLEKLAYETPDIILSDITMPKLDGYQFFRAVKEKFPDHEFTPFIFLSALSDRDSQLKGLRLGVDDYLAKPIDVDLLLMKIDLNLRRRFAFSKRLAMIETPRSKLSPTDDNDVEPASLQSAEAMPQRADGKIVMAKFELSAALGDQSSDMLDQIQQHAEITIRNQLEPEDLLYPASSTKFLVSFAKLPPEHIGSKVALIRDAVWEALYRRIHDETLASIHARSCVLTQTQLSDADDGSGLSAIDQLFDDEKEAAAAVEAMALLQSFQHDTLYAQNLLMSSGKFSKIKMLTFENEVMRRHRRFFNEGQYDGDFLIELHQGMFQRLREKRAFRQAFSKAVMLLPIRYQMMADQDCRERLTELCNTLEGGLGAILIIEIIETPDRFSSALANFKPLVVGRQLQFVELRRLEQLGRLELGQLGELGIAFFSMRFEHVLRQEKDVLYHLIQGFEAGGVKFHIKDIPKDRLNDAKDYNAHLYSVQ